MTDFVYTSQNNPSSLKTNLGYASLLQGSQVPKIKKNRPNLATNSLKKAFKKVKWQPWVI